MRKIFSVFATCFAILYFFFSFPGFVFAVIDYQYYQNISVKTIDELPGGYTLKLSFNHQKLVQENQSLENGNDVRIFYSSSGDFSDGEELDRVADNNKSWNLTETTIWFKTKDTIPISHTDSSHYRLYYGNTNPSNPPNDPNKVFDYYDDFEKENSDWTVVSGDWMIENGHLKAGSDNAYYQNNITTLENFYAEVQIISQPSQYYGIFSRAIDSNNFFLFNHDGNARDLRIYLKKNNIWNLLSAVNSPEIISGNYLSVRYVNNQLKGFINNIEYISVTNEDILGNKMGLFAGGSDNNVVFDNFQVRKAVVNDPEVSLLQEEITPQPSIAPTLTPTSTPTLTPILTPTSTPTPTPAIIITPTVTPTPTIIPLNLVLPKMLSAETMDTDQDGKIDQIKIIFNKDLNGTTVTNSDFTVSGYLLSSIRPLEDKGEVFLSLVEGPYFDTGQQPEATIRVNGVKDLDNNWNEYQVIETIDKSAPFIYVDYPTTTNYPLGSEIIFKGVASDYSSNEDAIVINVDIYIKKSGASEWEKIKTLINETLTEPFEWSYSWFPKDSGEYEIKIIATDFYDNNGEKILDQKLTVSSNPTTIPTETPTIPVTSTLTPTPTVTPATTPTPTLSSAPTPTPTPTAIPVITVVNENNNTISNNGDKSNSDSSNNAEYCKDEKPTASPEINGSLINNNEVILTWVKPDANVTKYALIYGLESGVYSYGVPDIGNGDITEYIVRNLTAENTYYFRLIPINGCMPGDYSNEIDLYMEKAEIEKNNENDQVLGVSTITQNEQGQINLPVAALKQQEMMTNKNSKADLIYTLRNLINSVFNFLLIKLKSFLD